MTTVPPTTIDEPLAAADRSGASAWSRGFAWVETRLAALAERANPILVKETRQALKSRQFLVTFLVVLIGCWIVSFVGVAMVGPQIYYAAAGPGMLVAYYTILVIPLMLIVPFTAFRSLAAEQEENTFDLLSITTLGSRQIITGKLLSALVQMVVYLSAVSPCIAFTFLLRGVDALTTAMLLVIAVLASVGLSMISLLVGALGRAKNMQVVISVALVLVLAAAAYGVWGMGVIVIEEGSMVFRTSEFWIVAFGMLSLYVTTFGLIHAAAAAQIAFVSENRSTPLRRWMMAQQACFCGWIGAILYEVFARPDGFRNEGPWIIAFAMCCAGVYWFGMGTLMTGEWPHLSRRVQRSLPSSTMGRALLSLLNPGPGTGYLFATANLTFLMLAALTLLALFRWMSGGTMPSIKEVSYLAVLTWAYVVAFLGFGRLIINALRRWAYVPMSAAFLIHVILFLSAIGVPTVIQMTSRELRNSGYTLWQMTNPVWTLSELARRGPSSVEGEVLILVLPAAALIALLLNMRSIATELLLQRTAIPVRIIEEEAELHPAPAPKPTNPWDADEPAGA